MVSATPGMDCNTERDMCYRKGLGRCPRGCQSLWLIPMSKAHVTFMGSFLAKVWKVRTVRSREWGPDVRLGLAGQPGVWWQEGATRCHKSRSLVFLPELFCCKNAPLGMGEMAQKLRALAAFPEDPH